MRVVGDHHDRLARLVDRLAHEREDLDAGAGVERAGRLVGEDDLGPRHERARDGDPLLLAARELARQVLEAVTQADGARRSVEPRLVGLLAGERQRQQDVLRRRERRDQVVLLEDEAEPVTPQQRELGLVERRELGVADEGLPRREPVEPGDALHQRALARARRSHDGGELARRERRP